jgi:ABC-type phosphate transport system substrate-binding protein
MTRPLRVVALMVSAVLALLSGTQTADAAAAHALIQGSGSSWAANAINQWVADVAGQGLQVVFTANGAAQGRKDWAARATDFGVSDIQYGVPDPNGVTDSPNGRAFAYLPIAAGGTALPYHVQVGNTLVRNLRLSGATIAKIFTLQITNWNDPAITADNNGHALPSLPIIPVVHSEGAGVTNQFTGYLAKQYPSIWAACNDGKAQATEFFPMNCGKSSGAMKAFAGSDGVMNFLKSPNANGAIATEEYSYPLLANYPSAKVLNQAGYFTLPTQYNVAVALTAAQINMDPTDPNYLTQKLDNVYVNSDPRTYPLSSYVYAIIPTGANDSTMTTAKRQTLADFLYYSICQGQREIGPIGYSSLPVNLVQAGFTQINKLQVADSGVDLTKRDVSTCNNPTFIAGHPEQNYLAQVAPQPSACDQTGAGPCTGAEGTYNATPGGSSSAKPSASASATAKSGAQHTSSPHSGSSPSPGATAAITDAAGKPITVPTSGAATPTTTAANDPAVPQAADPLAASSTLGAQPVASVLSANDGSSGTLLLGLLAGLLFVAALVTPAVVLQRSRGRRP